LIQVGSDERLRDDAIRFAENASDAGVHVQLEIWEGLWHVFQSSVGKVPEANEAIANITTFIEGVTSVT
jgi:acetyl esterase/lipase